MSDWQAPTTDPVVSSGASGDWKAPDTDPIAPGYAETAMRAVGNNFPFANQAVAKGESMLGQGDYSSNLQDLKDKAAEAKQANPKTYAAGAVGGALAPLAIPGVGEAMEAAPLTANAALGAASAMSDTDLSKNPGQAAKEGLEGAAMSAGTAGLLGKLLPTKAGMEESANNLANKSIGYGKDILNKMSPEEQQANGSFLRSNDLVGKDKQSVLDKAKDLQDHYGKKIGEISDTSQGMSLHVNPDEHYKAIQGLLQKADDYGGLENKEAKALAKGYTTGAHDILNLPANPNFSQIQKLKQQYGSLAFDGTGSIKDEAAKDTYFSLKDMLKGIVDKAQGDRDLPEEYKAALKGYSEMHPVVNGLEHGLDSELRGHSGNTSGVLHPGRLIAQLPGKARAIAGTTAAMMGHPYIGAAAALPELMNPAIQSKAAAALGRNTGKINSGITQEIMDYINSKRKPNED